MEKATAGSTFKTGQKAHGVYCGVPFSGAIGPDTRPTPDYRNIQFHIILDAPIVVFGAVRECVYIETNSDNILFLD